MAAIHHTTDSTVHRIATARGSVELHVARDVPGVLLRVHDGSCACVDLTLAELLDLVLTGREIWRRQQGDT